MFKSWPFGRLLVTLISDEINCTMENFTSLGSTKALFVEGARVTKLLLSQSAQLYLTMIVKNDDI